MMAATCSPPVLLGVCDAACPDVRLSPYENKIGGYPDFFATSSLGAPPPCRLCHAPLPLLLQVYCPLDGSPYHRLIHVFCCPKPSCCSQATGWLVLRSQLRDPGYCCTEKYGPKTSRSEGQRSWELHTTDWCEDADDWGSDNEGTGQIVVATTASEMQIGDDKSLHSRATTETERCTVSVDTCGATEMAMLSLEDPEPPSSQYLGPFFPPKFIRVVEAVATDFDTAENAKIQALLQKYQQEHQDIFDENVPGRSSTKRKQASASGSRTGASSRSQGEGYEKVVARHGDRTFQKFYKQLSKCPEQIMRYCLKGTPLLINGSHTQRPPEGMKCKHCGAPCEFELQLMPPLIYLIQKALEDGESQKQAQSKAMVGERDPRVELGIEFGVSPRIEFGTVLVFTCSASCWDESSHSFREEMVIIQQDADDRIVQRFLQGSDSYI